MVYPFFTSDRTSFNVKIHPAFAFCMVVSQWESRSFHGKPIKSASMLTNARDPPAGEEGYVPVHSFFLSRDDTRVLLFFPAAMRET
jgi:hypothetical protein